MDIDQLKPGQELDELIARDVMGWLPGLKGAWVDGHNKGRVYFIEKFWDDDVEIKKEIATLGDIFRVANKFKLWQPSRDIASAWTVIDKLKSLNIDKYSAPSLFSVPMGWSLLMYEKNDSKSAAWLEAFGETAPLAICKGALRAVNGKVNREWKPKLKS